MTNEINCDISIDASESLKSHWENFVKSFDNNRFFINKEDVFLKIFINRVNECIIKQNETYYRARENKNGNSFRIKDLKAPSSDICNEGRLNPKGVSYMYIADSPITAISEIRVWIGATVQVAKCVPKKELVLKDFDYDSNEKDPMILKYNKLLCEMFSKPISVYDKEKEYRITQCIAEYLKYYAKRKDNTIGYDGIKYKSSAHSDGYSIVIFNPDDVNILEVSDIMTIKNIIVDCPETVQFK